jgi:signal transduction histidine kinase/ligand-binding sensor domain-containing protein/DNA-binding NarL/FixJ family response regulator
MNQRITLLIYCIVGITIHAISQKNEFGQIYKYTNEQGLVSNFVYQIVQDKKGFIWIGTEEGLNKFDGKNFTEFTTRPGRYSLSHNRAQTLMLAPDGNIWVGTSDGINIYDYKSDSIIQVKTNTSPLKLVYNDITCLTMSKNNRITWIGTYGDGLHYFDWNKRVFSRFRFPKIIGAKEPLLVMRILEDDNKRLWIGTQNNGLYRYDIEQRTLEYCKLKDQNQNISAIYQDSYRRLWIGTSKGCYVYNETTGEFEAVTYPAGLSTGIINSFREDQQGKLWIGSDLFLYNFPVRLFSRTDKFAYQAISHGESVYDINCPSITSLLVDRDNNVWIGTVWGGVNMMQGQQPKFKLYKQDPDKPLSLPKTPITGISRDSQGNLILSTTTKGIYKMNPFSSDFRKLITSKNYEGYDFQTVMVDRDQNIWLGTFKNGLIKLNRNGAEIANIVSNPADSSSLPNNDVRCVLQTNDNKIWVGTQRGIAVINPENQHIEKVIRLYNNTGIRTIKEGADGLIWIGTYGAGAVTYNQLTGKLDYQPTPFANPLIVFDITINNGKVWLATHGDGVYGFDPKSKKYQSYSEKDGLVTNFTNSIMADKQGVIWIGTVKGISKINPKTGEVQNFNNQDGVQSQGLYERSVYMLPDGQMLFGGTVGLNIFNPQNVYKNDHCPPVLFTRLSVFNQTITPSEKGKSPLKENITTADNIRLKYDQSVFTIEFIGLNYNATQKIQYAYLLEGTDSRWNYIGNQNSVTFRNLSPGTYTLKVKASSPDGVWCDDNTASITIVISPPFWLSWWAFVLYSIIIGAILYFIWQFLTLKIRSANELRIERAKLEKEEELHQEKLQFFTNISHEFRTPLTLLIGPLEKLQTDETDEAKKSNIRLMLRNARRLLLMVNQLLDFRKAEKGQMNLNVRYADIIGFVSEITRSYEELKQSKNIQFNFEHSDTELMTWFDAEFIDKCLFNLLSNAFKFTPEKGSISVSVRRVTDSATGANNIEIAVTDNGKGIAGDEISLIFNQFYVGKEHSKMQPGSGIGLHLTQLLVELHHGTIRVESTPGLKTVFTINIPSDQKAYAVHEFAGENATVVKQENGMIDSDTTIYEHSMLEKASGDRHKKRILLVEDNAEIRSYITEILGSGYVIDEAGDGKTGLQLATEKEYHLIITDLMMPVMDGLEMCKQLRMNIETDHIPIIMLTAKSTIENRIEGLNAGADSYISKPFHPEHLTVRVSKLIEQRELFRERFSKKISLESIQNQSTQAESPNEQFLQKAITVILDKMVDSDFNGDALAAELYISRMGLHRKVKALTGQSTGEFIRNVRLKRACELLAIPGKSISEVCYEVGFNSPSYFTTCFTETYKMTPSEYARQPKKST